MTDEHEQAGTCDTCGCAIMDNDPAAWHDDGAFCKACAPTYRDLLADPGMFADPVTGEDVKLDEAMEYVQRHIDRGGSLDDPMLSGTGQ